MPNNLLLYSLSNKYYYDDIEYKTESKELHTIANSILNDKWNIEKSGVYYLCNYSNAQVPNQGWKIHISANLENAKPILDITSDVLAKEKVPFKFIVDLEMLRFTTQKIYPRGSSGKFITIYPKDDTQFLQLLDILYDKLKTYDGPYVLSDKRYKDCKVLYYRYGGMKCAFKIDKNGDKVPMILNGNNQWVTDERKPHFHLPDNIKNIVNEENTVDQLKYIGVKYRIDNPIMFSNSGGVYSATNLENNEKVIIKEARPNTCLVKNNIDSVYLRKKEFKILREIEKYNITPKAIELFQEWEHYFLVEEYIEGMNLHSYCAEYNPFYKTNIDSKKIDTYINNLIYIFIKIVDALTIFHNHNLIIVDMSPNNIIVTPSLDIKIIDLEACLEKEGEPFYQLGTFGFYEAIKENNFFESDLYSLGANLFSCMIRRNELLKVKKDTISIFINELFNDYKLPLDLKNLILDLTQKDPSNRPSLEEIKIRLTNMLFNDFDYMKTPQKYDYNVLNEKYRKNIERCLDTIESTANLNRKDRLFPNTPYVDNGLNITSGALGIMYTFKSLKEDDRIIKYIPWISKNLEEIKSYPPGLYVGLAGMAWVLLEIGKIKEAKILLDKCNSDILNTKDFSIYYGLSGYGLTLIKFWLKTKDNSYLDKAIEVGEKLVSNSKKGLNYVYWEDEKNTVHVGYKEGSSGISLFLLYLYIVTQNQKYLNCGIMGLNHDLLYKIKDNEYNIYSFPKDTISSKPSYPYFMVGSAGIISVLLRYYVITKQDSFLNEVLEMLPSIHLKYSISPTLFTGLAGLGNILLDCYQFLGDEIYKEQAYDIAEGIDLYKVCLNDGLLYPDNQITKLSTDFGNGTSGIILFLNRLIGNKSNFCFYLDELLDENKYSSFYKRRKK